MVAEVISIQGIEPEVISMQTLLRPEVMSTSCADVMITLLRNGIVRNDETQTQNIFFEMYIIKIFTVNND